jgi:hypothetical protein
MDDAQPIDDELLRMTGNPHLAVAVKAALERLSSGAAGEELAEMATELLAGRASLRDIGRSEAYATRIAEGFAEFERWQSALGPEEREELVRKVRDEFD